MLKGYRTYLFNIAAALIPLVEVLGLVLNVPEIRGIIPLEYLPWYSVAVALVNLYLRRITTTPPGKM